MKATVVCVCAVLMLMCQATAGHGQTTTGGMAVKVGILGVGFDGAVGITEKSSVRIGVNFFNFNHDFDDDGITLAAQLKLRSVMAQYDWFPTGGGFHVSPGVMIHNGNRVEASTSVPAGGQFTLGSASLMSNPSNPVGGDARVAFEKVAPALTLGWGNIAHGERRWSIPVELGVVLSRAPTATFNLSGSACLPNGTNCRNVATEPALQAEVRDEEADLNHSLEKLKMIPVFSFGFGYRF